jgi:hypothetical protein
MKASHGTRLCNTHEPQAMPALPPIGWRLDAFALVRLPCGSRYEVLRSWDA